MLVGTGSEASPAPPADAPTTEPSTGDTPTSGSSEPERTKSPAATAVPPRKYLAPALAVGILALAIVGALLAGATGDKGKATTPGLADGGNVPVPTSVAPSTAPSPAATTAPAPTATAVAATGPTAKRTAGGGTQSGNSSGTAAPQPEAKKAQAPPDSYDNAQLSTSSTWQCESFQDPGGGNIGTWSWRYTFTVYATLSGAPYGSNATLHRGSISESMSESGTSFSKTVIITERSGSGALGGVYYTVTVIVPDGRTVSASAFQPNMC
ncbi:hypothetical protein Drose_25715 [Dactylosporangium roseum]|uniref:Serine/threonine protein kinase n=1 Tax=Dactylosporangium roseum TaxID=47989 RepID=A0ABY5YZ02_9ACTN|nr:hypothetical protein [Dactylosporangium roseum]UWZ34606.1 hypothetical protein Drose_25715 [Dactylosporangium roseum]